MTLLTAHKILIGAAIAFFLFYAAFEARRHFAGDSGAWLRAMLAAGGAAGFAAYLRWVVLQGKL